MEKIEIKNRIKKSEKPGLIRLGFFKFDCICIIFEKNKSNKITKSQLLVD